MQKKHGFTAIELLAVLAIILTIVGIGIPAYNSFRNRGRIAKARAVIQKIEMAAEMYRTDFGEYPGDPDVLVTGVDSGYGPYMDSRDFSGGSFIDPWGSSYEYKVTGETLRITSYGPDMASGTNDDISNIEMR